MENIQYSGPSTTANSEKEGRLKVDAGTKRKIIKKKLDGAGGILDTVKSGLNKVKSIGRKVGDRLVENLTTREGAVSPIPKDAAFEWNDKTKSFQGKVTPGNFPTKSKKNAAGEIINPTASDISSFNSKFKTIIPKTSKRSILERSVNKKTTK